MLSEPKVEERAAQPYVALLRQQVPLRELGNVLPPLHDDVLQWLQKRGVSPAGAPFFRYVVVDMQTGLFDVEVGWPTAAPVVSDGTVTAGALPAGRYATILHTGPFEEVGTAHMALNDWGKANGITWQTSDHGRVWGGNIEFYITDPSEEPDNQKWETEVAFLIG